MTEQATANAVRHSVTVPIDPERAFRLFTEEIETWWPKDSHTLLEGPSTGVFETRDGGRWYERGEDGRECTIGTVVAWEPPARFVLAWQLTPAWEFDPDLERATHVEVTFEPDAQGGTRVTLEHRGFEVHGDAGAGMRDSVGGEGGWPMLMKLYSDAAAA